MDNSSGNQANVQASLSGRYATALFELAREAKAIDSVEASLTKVQKALSESSEFAALTTDASISRDAAKQVVAAIAKAMKLDALTAKTLGVLAENRRLAETAGVARAFAALASAHRGEIAIASKIDPTILGGLTVKIGSTLIDNSIKTRLNSLAQAMKG